MNRNAHNLLEYSVYIFATIMVVLVGLFTPQFGFTTTDDSSFVTDYLVNYEGGSSVLGARSTSSEGKCPSDRPIVGWLTYEGDKVLATTLPEGEEPTVCFRSYEEAYREGFVDEQ
jgi:hypothetical protein